MSAARLPDGYYREMNVLATRLLPLTKNLRRSGWTAGCSERVTINVSSAQYPLLAGALLMILGMNVRWTR